MLPPRPRSPSPTIEQKRMYFGIQAKAKFFQDSKLVHRTQNFNQVQCLPKVFDNHGGKKGSNGNENAFSPVRHFSPSNAKKSRKSMVGASSMIDDIDAGSYVSQLLILPYPSYFPSYLITYHSTYLLFFLPTKTHDAGTTGWIGWRILKRNLYRSIHYHHL